MRKFLAALVVAALLSALASCSSGDGGRTGSTTGPAKTTSTTLLGSTKPGGTAADYAASLTVGLTRTSGKQELQLSKTEAGCVAEVWVAVMGAAVLADKKVAPADLENPDFAFPKLGLSLDQGLKMVDVYSTCHVNIFEQFTAVLAEGLDATQTACLRANLTDEVTRQFLAATLVSNATSADLSSTLDKIDTTCRLSPGSPTSGG